MSNSDDSLDLLNTSEGLDDIELAELDFHDEDGNPLQEEGRAVQGPVLNQEAQTRETNRRRERAKAMAQKSKCPVFSEEENYNTFKLRCQAFLSLTDIDVDKRGLYLGLNALPTNIQQRFLDENPTDTLQGVNSEQVFWNFLGSIYEKDPLMEMCTKMKEFMGFKRTEGSSIKEYITEFEARYNRARAKQVPELPKEMLMFMLLEGSKIPEKDKRLIMVEVNFEDKANIFQNTKNSMMKLFGGLIKEEASYDPKVYEALYNKGAYPGPRGGGGGGFRPSFNTQRMQNPFHRGQSNFRGYGRPPGPPRAPLGTASGGGRHPGPSRNATNPPLNGRPRNCFQCGSTTHFIAACPELNGWPTFYAGMCQGQESEPNFIGPDGQFNDYMYGAYNYGQEEGNHGGHHEPEGYYQVDTGNPNQHETESIIGAAAALTLRDLDPVEEPKTYFNTYTCLLTTKMAPFLKEALNKIYLDTGCVKTVSGKIWVDNTLEAMSDDVRKLVRFSPSTAHIKFGEGEAQKSYGTLTLPLSIAGQNLFLTTEVVDTEIPCLLSNQAIEDVGMIINMKERTVIFEGETVPIIKTKTGHAAIKFDNFDMREKDEFYAMVTLNPEESQVSYSYDQLKKIHDNLGHPSRPVMEKMLDSAKSFNKDEKESLNKLYAKCSTCFIHKKSKPRPKVSPPMANDFNDVISMDLKFFHKYNTIVLYIIDLFSRYIAAHVIPDKKPESVIRPLLQSWIMTRFGAPRAIITDNGGEFVNQKMTNLCHNFGIKMYTTAGYSAHQNGINERQHATCDEIIKKMMTSGQFKNVKEALGPAVFAQNIRTASSGFSPHQIIFGRNPRIPGAMENEPPAQTTRSKDELVQKNIKGIFEARLAVAKVENQKRLSTAEKTTHAGKMIFVKEGEWVYYRMGEDPDWQGPGRVLGQDGKLIFIRHGRNYIVASPSRVQKVTPEYEYTQVVNPNEPKISNSQPKISDKPRLAKIPANSTQQTPPKPPPSTESDSDSDDEFFSDVEEDNLHNNDFIQPQSPDQSRHSDNPLPEIPSPRATDSPPDQFSPQGPTHSTPTSPVPTNDNTAPHNSPDQSYTLTQPFRTPTQNQSLNSNEEAASPNLRKMGKKRQNSGSLSPPTPLDCRQTLRSGSKKFKKVPKNKKSPGQSPYQFHNPRVYPKTGQWIYIHDPEDSDQRWRRVTVLNRATKGSKSSFGPYFNIQEKEKRYGIYLDMFDWHFEGAGYQSLEPTKDDVRNYLSFDDEMMTFEGEDDYEGEFETEEGVFRQFDDPDLNFETYVTIIPRKEHWRPEIVNAKKKELAKFVEYGVYQEIADVGQPRISTDWVATPKMIDNKPDVKTRLVCRGNEAKLEDLTQKVDSPTVKRESVKLMMALAANNKWEVKCQDVTSAFLQAKKLERDIYVQPPIECEYKTPTLWKLVRPMYGLDEASFLWYETIRDYLRERGCKSPVSDPAFFYWHKDGKLEGILTTWVDDIFSCGSENFKKEVMEPLTSRFKFGAFHQGDFKVLGMNIIHRGSDIYISQDDYIRSKIEPVDIQCPPGVSPGTEVPEEEKSKIYEAVGKIRWISDQTRPDLCYEELEMSIKQRKATYKDVKLLNKMIKRAQEETYWIKYTKIPGSKWFISVFVDASLGGLPGRTDSAFGFAIFLSDGYNPTEKRTCVPITWHCAKINRVTTSTYEAESIALKFATEIAINFKTTLQEITNIPDKLLGIQIFCDNHHVVSSIFTTKDTCKSPMVIRDIGRMKQIVDRGDITSLSWIPTDQNLADCFTKGTASKIPLITALNRATFFY